MIPRILALALFAGTAWAADYPATLDWSGRVTLAMPVSGVVEHVAPRAGQRVQQGELLARLNPTLFKAGVAEAMAELHRLTEEEAEAKRDLDRVGELYARTVSATTELDAAKLRHARARAGLDAAQARVERARHQLAESELRAPFDALVLVRHAEPGLVAATPCQPNPLFTVARAGEMLALATLSPAQAGPIRLGGTAEVSVAGKTLKGELRALTAQGDGRYVLEVAIPRAPGLLAGQPASIRLP